MTQGYGRQYVLVALAAYLLFAGGVGGWFLISFYNGSLAPPAISDSVSFNEKAVWLSSRLRDGCDVLTIGSSMSLNNLHSDTIRRHFPAQRYINAAAWGMPPEQSAEYLRSLSKFCRPKLVLLSTRIWAFSDRSRPWLFRKQLLEDMWDGASQLLTHLKSFSFNYYADNAGDINRVRRVRTEYASLNFDENGGVPFEKQGFRIGKRRWEARPVPAAFRPGDRSYKALVEIAETVESLGARLVVVQSPIRSAVIDTGQDEALQAHWQRLERLGAEHGFQFVNLGRSRLFDDEHFVDSTHLNAQGARLFTQEVLKRMNPRADAIQPAAVSAGS